jgi:hypothetical protein
VLESLLLFGQGLQLLLPLGVFLRDSVLPKLEAATASGSPHTSTKATAAVQDICAAWRLSIDQASGGMGGGRGRSRTLGRSQSGNIGGASSASKGRSYAVDRRRLGLGFATPAN